MAITTLDQLVAEVAIAGTPPSRLEQLVAEVALSGNPRARLSQLVAEVALPFGGSLVDLVHATGQLWPRGGDKIPNEPAAAPSTGGAEPALFLSGRLI